MLCGLKTILTDMNILNSYRHIRPKKVKYPIPEIPDDSGKKSGTDWVLPKIIGSGRVSGTRQTLDEGFGQTQLFGSFVFIWSILSWFGFGKHIFMGSLVFTWSIYFWRLRITVNKPTMRMTLQKL